MALSKENEKWIETKRADVRQTMIINWIRLGNPRSLTELRKLLESDGLIVPKDVVLVADLTTLAKEVLEVFDRIRQLLAVEDEDKP